MAAAVALDIAPKVSLIVLTQAKCTWLCYAISIRALFWVFQKGIPTYASLATLFLSPSYTTVPSICLSFSLWLRHFILRFLASQAFCCDLYALVTMFCTAFSQWTTILLTFLTTYSSCIRYEPDQVLWNLNQNETAAEVMDYWGMWENHSELSPPQVVHGLTIPSLQSIAGKLALPILHIDARPIC